MEIPSPDKPKDALSDKSSDQLKHIENVDNEKGLDTTAFVEDDQMTKKLLRKVDVRLIPMLSLLYLMSYMDRSMIGNARIAGLQTDLSLSDDQFRMCLMVFFIPYALLEVPANVMLKLLKARLWLTIITLAWGAVMTLSGLVNNYAGLVSARFFLGVTEAGCKCCTTSQQFLDTLNTDHRDQSSQQLYIFCLSGTLSMRSRLAWHTSTAQPKALEPSQASLPGYYR